MLWITLGAIGIAGVMFVYQNRSADDAPPQEVRRGRRQRDWIEQQRGRSQDSSR